MCAALGIDPFQWTQELVYDIGIVATGPRVIADTTLDVDNVTLTAD